MMPAPAVQAPAFNLLLVDDHPLVRDGLRARLESTTGFKIVAEAGSTDEALAQAQIHPIDMALVDINLGATSGIDLTARFRTLHPHIAVLILSMHDGADYVALATRAGARGYVLKGAPAAEIIAAIHAILSGGTYYSSQLKASVAAPAKLATLTPREKEVLQLIAHGKSNKHMARELDLSVSTIDTHRINIKRKLGLEGKSELIRFGLVKEIDRGR